MLKVVLKDGKVLYSNRSFNSVFSELFNVGICDLENGFAISSDSFLAIENLTNEDIEKVEKEMRWN